MSEKQPVDDGTPARGRSVTWDSSPEAVRRYLAVGFLILFLLGVFGGYAVHAPRVDSGEFDATGTALDFSLPDAVPWDVLGVDASAGPAPTANLSPTESRASDLPDGLIGRFRERV